MEHYCYTSTSCLKYCKIITRGMNEACGRFTRKQATFKTSATAAGAVVQKNNSFLKAQYGCEMMGGIISNCTIY